jgi:NTE family protein
MQKIKPFICLLLILLSVQLHAQKVGVVLSGGGARAYAHIGVLKALEENNIPIDYITGTSMGALIGSMYATGLSPDQIEKIVTSNEFIDRSSGKMSANQLYFYNDNDPDASWLTIKLSYDSVLRMRLPESAIKSENIDYALMESYAPAVAKANGNFDSLLVPFRCVAADIKKKEPVIFSKGDLARAVRASMAFPFYLPPVTVDNKIMFDGGLYNNFPCDIMLKDFNPDIIIGSSVGNSSEVVIEDNILSQVRTMIVQQATNYNVPRPTDFLITTDNTDVGVFDFSMAQEAIDSGYNATMKNIEAIKKSITRRISADEITQKRAAFFDEQHPIIIDTIIVNGVKDNQKEYFQKIIKPTSKSLIPYYLKQHYFRLIADDNVRYVFPKLVYNPQTKNYDLFLDIKRNNNLSLDIGGDLSSRPINTGFVGIQYNLLKKQSFRFYANTYFGKFYNSAHAEIRIDFQGRNPFFIQPNFTYNSYNYFKSSSYFLEDVKPAYLIQDDSKTGLQIGIPSRQVGKIYADGGYVVMNEKYYQTLQFTQLDTADLTKFTGATYGINYVRNTLNKKMYADKGSFVSSSLRYIKGVENTIPGTQSIYRDTINTNQEWFQFKFTWENYFAKAGRFHFSYYAQLVLSTQGFFSNYTATILSAPAFQPTPQSKTVFLPEFHAFNFAGGGLRTVYSPFSNFDLRLEGYVFQPYQEIIPGEANDAPSFGEPYAKRYFMATLEAVYHTPVGPASVGLNYYQNFEQPVTFMFHFGFIIFNKSAFE